MNTNNSFDISNKDLNKEEVKQKDMVFGMYITTSVEPSIKEYECADAHGLHLYVDNSPIFISLGDMFVGVKVGNKNLTELLNEVVPKVDKFIDCLREFGLKIYDVSEYYYV